MSGRIPPQFIDELVNRVDIVDLINSRVPLKKAGKDYQACCPFHDEKTPSFTVSRDKQFYHCFGCGAHGTAIGFLMDYDSMGFVDAIEELAARENLEIPREAGTSAGPDYRPLYDTLEQSARFYQWQLRKHPKANLAVGYLKQRGLSGEVTAEYGIGYAPDGWDNLIGQLGREKEQLEKLRTAGMLSESDSGKSYDRFRDRIMFPIRNHRGLTIAFGGRMLDDGKPKYLNSPETPVFHKGRELYGLFEAHQALRKIERLLVVEGYMDVVALAQFGIRYAVATLGTATTPEHLGHLFRTTPEIIFCFDGDRAGREAGWKALEISLPHMRDGREIRFLFLPDSEDPDTMIRKEGMEKFQQRILHAKPISDFLFDRLTEQVDMSSLGGKAQLAEQAKTLLAKLPTGLFKEMMHKRLGELIGLNPGSLGNSPAATTKPNRRAKRKTGGAQQTIPPVRRAITLLLKQPELAAQEELNMDWIQYEAPEINLLRQLLELIQNQPKLNTAQIIERWRGREAFPHLERLWSMENEAQLPNEGLKEEFRGALQRLSEQQHKQKTSTLIDKIGAGNASESEKQQLTQLLEKQAGAGLPQTR